MNVLDQQCQSVVKHTTPPVLAQLKNNATTTINNKTNNSKIALFFLFKKLLDVHAPRS